MLWEPKGTQLEHAGQEFLSQVQTFMLWHSHRKDGWLSPFPEESGTPPILSSSTRRLKLPVCRVKNRITPIPQPPPLLSHLLLSQVSLHPNKADTGRGESRSIGSSGVHFPRRHLELSCVTLSYQRCLFLFLKHVV